MAQESTPITTGSIKQNVEANGGELIRPQDVTTVYSTGTTKHVAEGQPMAVHPSLAEKLIAKGKATDVAPKKKGGKEA